MRTPTTLLLLALGLLLPACGDDATPPATPPTPPPAEEPAVPPPPPNAKPLAWTLPAGWEQRPKRSMRIVSAAPAAAKGTECYVSALRGDGGGLLANVNRWRRQMGLQTLQASDLDALERIRMLDTDAVLVSLEGTYRGMGGQPIEHAGLLGAICPRPQTTVFVKMIGPASEVADAREAFLALCRSLRRGGP